MNEEEIEYRELAKFPGYRVGTDGSVWRKITKSKTWIKMTPWLKGDKYMVGLNKGEHSRFFRYVHELVLGEFVGPKEVGKMGKHINGDKSDNRLENLVWADIECDMRKVRGIKHHDNKLMEDTVKRIRYLYKLGSFTQHQLANMFGITQQMIDKIVRYKSWKHI